MKDIHTHILYDVDDGPNSLNNSIELLKLASENNVTDIILTPHYIKNTKYSINNHKKEELFKKLKQSLTELGINLNLYLGNEVYIDTGIITLLKEDIKTLNNSRYILIELPKREPFLFLEEALLELKRKELIPIIAHPERYYAYYQDYDFFNELIKKGCLLQGNIGSLYGIYGKKAKRMLKEMLKRNMIHFLASDIHSKKTSFNIKKVEKKVLKIVKEKKIVENLLINNAKKIIDNKKWSE